MLAQRTLLDTPPCGGRASQTGGRSQKYFLKRVRITIWGKDLSQEGLRRAVQEGDAEFVKLLLDKGTDVNTKDEIGETPLLMASQFGHSGVVGALLDNGADANLKNKSGYTALHYAAISGNYHVGKLLTDRGADINARDKDGWTALMWAANRGFPDLVELLLEKGADVNAKDEKGSTLLMKVVTLEQDDEITLKIVKALLAHGGGCPCERQTQQYRTEVGSEFTPSRKSWNSSKPTERRNSVTIS